MHSAHPVLQYRLKANRTGGFTEEQLAVEVRVRAGWQLLVWFQMHRSGEVLQQQPTAAQRGWMHAALTDVCSSRHPAVHTLPSGSHSCGTGDGGH